MGEEIRHRELAEQAASLRLPEKMNERLQHLMDRNTNGLLDQEERDELESIIAISETMSILRGRALHILGRKP